MKTLSQWKLGGCVVLIFLAGAASGAFLSYQMTRHSLFAAPQTNKIKARLRSRFQARLNLTPAQAQKIDPLLDRAMSQVEVIHRDLIDRIFANMSNLNAQIVAELTPEQKVQFEDLERERRERLRQRFGLKPGAP